MLARLDDLYGAKGALVDLAGALRTPEGLEPRLTWWHSFRPSGGPVWGWVRPGPGQRAVDVSAMWGVLRLSLSRTCDPRGLLITVPSSAPNPPVRVDMGSPGWVDFGHGQIPGVLGIPTVNAMPRVCLVGVHDHVTALFHARLRTLLSADKDWRDTVRRFVGDRGDLVDHAFSEPAPVVPDDSTDLGLHPPSSAFEMGMKFSGEQYRRLRDARGLSRAAVASQVSALLERSPMTDDQVEVVETGGQPVVERLGSRLDTVYRADGHTCIEPVTTSPVGPGAEYALRLPGYWIGPVWVMFTASHPDEIGSAVVRWPPWQKLVRVRSGVAISFRRSVPDQPDPTVVAPAGWTIQAGIGVHPHAVDVNRGWTAIDEGNAVKIFDDFYEVYLQSFGRTKEEFVRFLRSRFGL